MKFTCSKTELKDASRLQTAQWQLNRKRRFWQEFICMLKVQRWKCRQIIFRSA